MERDQHTGLLCRCPALLGGKELYSPLLLSSGPNENTESFFETFQSYSRRVEMCDCLKKCGALWGRNIGLSPFMLRRTFYIGLLASLNYHIEKVEMHSHLCLVSLWSRIKAFVPSVVSTEITPDMGLVISGSEDPDEAYS